MKSYNEESVMNDFNRLLDLYLNCNDLNKVDLYSQMLFVYDIDASWARKNKIFSYKPKDYGKILKERFNIKRERYLELDSLSKMICFNLNREMERYYPLYLYGLKNDNYSYDEYMKGIREFLGKVFPNDLVLFDRDITYGNLIIKKDFLFSSAEIYYLDDIEKYYIMITYYKYLNAFNMASTIHEYGHASTFVNGGVYESKDYIMNEVISTLYELIFLDYYLRMYCDDKYYNEIVSIFNASCIYRLNNIFMKRYKYNSSVISMLEAIYGQLIGVTIYNKYYDKNLLEVIELLKNNYARVDAFELLKSIDIDENDLIDTSLNVSKLVLKK